MNSSRQLVPITFRASICNGTTVIGFPLEPAGLGWLQLTSRRFNTWLHRATHAQVISACDHAALPRSGSLGFQWHVSIVDRRRREPQRPTAKQVKIARCAFNMLAAEDNHHPGNARHFWLPCDPDERVDCECKAEEVTVTDADGYRWTNPKEGLCRGCDLARTMAALGKTSVCPLHHSVTVSA